jgi:hypothetical protein
MKTKFLLFCFLALLLTGCPSEEVKDISSLYSQEPTLQKGYRLGASYVLQRDLIVGKVDRHDYVFTKPGDGVPTVEQWQTGIRKTQIELAIAMLPAGTKVKVEKIIYLKESGSGVSHATGMLRAEGVDLLINPFAISHFLSVPYYGTLCLPDKQSLQLSPSQDGNK